MQRFEHPAGLSIGQVAAQAGVAASTIRYYEQIDLLPPARRVNGRRQYDSSILEQLAFIQITQRLGFTLGEIGNLFGHEQATAPLPDLWQTLARQKLADVEQVIRQARQVQQLLRHGLHCQCPNLTDCIQCVRANCAKPADQ